MTPFIASMTNPQGAGSLSENQSNSSPFGNSVTSMNPMPANGNSFGNSLSSMASLPAQPSMPLASPLASPPAGNQHANLTAPGISASIIETVSCWLEQGNATRAVVTGEVALSHNAGNDSFPLTAMNETIKLDNFASLEKVAANPTFVSQVNGNPGEYTLNIGSISGQTATAFKYQVHVDDSNVTAYAPIILTPTWRVEPTQTSVILTYSLNPAFQIAQADQTLRLSHVVFAIALGGGRATACLSKPAGTFSRERGTIYWRVPEVTLHAGSASEKLLARFTTEGEASPGKVDVRWEIVGQGALGSGLGVRIAKEGDSGGNDPFADDDNGGRTWEEVAGERRLVSGTYTAA